MNTKKSILTLAGLTLFVGSPFSHAASEKVELPADYPLKTCVISGEKLGDHGEVVKVSDDGTDVYLCCKMCTKDFAKEPAKYTKMVKDANALKTP